MPKHPKETIVMTDEQNIEKARLWYLKRFPRPANFRPVKVTMAGLYFEFRAPGHSIDSLIKNVLRDVAADEAES